MDESTALVLEHCAGLGDQQLLPSLRDAVQGYLAKYKVAEAAGALADLMPPDRFMHELRDWAVFTGGASGFVIVALGAAIGGPQDERRYPPPHDGSGDGFYAWLARWRP